MYTFLLVKQCFPMIHFVHDSAKSVRGWRRKEVNVFIYARQLYSGVSLIPLLPHDTWKCPQGCIIESESKLLLSPHQDSTHEPVHMVPLPARLKYIPVFMLNAEFSKSKYAGTSI